MRSTGRRLLAFALMWALTAATFRVTLLAPEVCPPLTAAEAREAAVAGVDWIARNQDGDGKFLYQYDRRRDEIVDDYNVVRHAGTTMSLYQAVAAGAGGYLGAADAGTGYMLDRLVVTGDDATAWAEPGTDVKLGAAALLAVSLLIRRQATGDPVHDDLLRRLGRFMQGQQAPGGAMYDVWWRDTATPDPSQLSRYATGEALWALAQLHEVFPGEGWDTAAWPTLDYLALRRDLEEELFPSPWPDQWAAYSLATMADWDLETHHVDYARRLSAAFGVQVRWDAQRSGGLATLSHPPPPRGASFGTVLEGLGSLLTVAESDDRLGDLAEPLAERLACGASRIAAWQTGVATIVGPAPGREIGAWFLHDETRVDDQQHAASGLLEAERVLPGTLP